MNIIPLNTDIEGNCSCLKANYYKMAAANFIGHTKDGFKATCVMEITEAIGCAMRGRNPENTSERGRSNGKHKQRIEMGSNISNTTTSVQKDALVVEPICLNSKVDGKQPSLADRIYDVEGIATCVTTSFHPNIAEPNILTPKRTDFGKKVRKQYENKEINMSRHDMTQLEPRQDGVSNTITSVQKDNLLAEPIILTVGYLNEGKHQQDYIQHEDGISRALCCGTHGSGPHLTKTMVSEKPIIIDDYNQRVPQDQDVIGTVTTQFGNPAPRHGYKIAIPLRTHQAKYRIRKLTPREAFRLMGVTETDIDKIQQSGVSQSQQYKMAGNSIVVDVLEHIFRKMFVETGQESQQLSLF